MRVQLSRAARLEAGRAGQRPAPALCPSRAPQTTRRAAAPLRAEPPSKDGQKGATKTVADKVVEELSGLGDGLGPIGLSYSASTKKPKQPAGGAKPTDERSASVENKGGVALGPIGLSFGTEFAGGGGSAGASAAAAARDGAAGASTSEPSVRAESIHSMSTAEWRSKYEKDGTVDLWVEEEFNAGSRLVGGRAVHKGGAAGFRTGEGTTAGDVPVHTVRIFNHHQGREFEVQVPEDRYILWEAEDKGLELPWACRMGCCTACAVRIKEGTMHQPEALGISAELKDMGYGLMCVGYPSSDLVMETVSEDEVYDLQFGVYFAQQALDPSNPDTIERDDYALSVANMDE